MDDASFAPQENHDAADVANPDRPEPRMPCIGLMGEFSAGKTTLINFLLGEDLLPTRVTATQLPPVWMSFGERAAHYVDSDGNQHALGFDDFQTVPVEGVQYIKVFCEADILLEMDLIDTPGISDPNIPDHHRAAVVDYVDAVIWCTHSTQAWRESERSVWMTIPDALQANSILLATRADKLGERDRGRVLQRLKREIGDRFRQIIMFSATDAIRACQTEDETGLLAASGGATLIETLQAISSEIAAASGMPSRALKAAEVASEPTVMPIRPARVFAVRPNRPERPGSRHAERRDVNGTEIESVAALAEQRVDSPTSLNVPLREAVETEADDNDAHPGDRHDAATADEGPEDALAVDMTEAADAVEVADPENEVGMSSISDSADSDKDDATGEAMEIVPSVKSGAKDAGADGDPSSLTGVLDLGKYEVSRPAPAPCEDEPADVSDTNDIADFLVRTRKDARPSNGEECGVKTQETGEDLAACHRDDQYDGEPVSARVLWDEIVATTPVRTVPELAAAFGRFISALEDNGLVIANPVPAVDMGREQRDTSGWRMQG